MARGSLALFVAALIGGGCTGPELVSPSVARVVVSPQNDTLTVAESLLVAARVEDGNGASLSGRPIRWQSSDTTVARVSGAGVVTPLAAGTTVISAEVEGVAGQAMVWVRDPFVTLEVDRRLPSVFEGDTIQLTARAMDSSGRFTSFRVGRWASGDPSVAVVGGSGIATGKAVGTVQVRITLGQRSDSVELAVVAKRVGPNRGLAFLHNPGIGASVDEAWFQDGSGTVGHRVSSPGSPVYWFGWSADGALLVVGYAVADSTKRIGIIDVDEGTHHYLPGGGGYPDLSPDHRAVAFTYEKPVPERNGIATASIDGTGLRRLTELPGEQLLPRWSPDGRQIAFMARESDAPLWEVWVVRADLTYPRRLAVVTGLRAPVWSPDGKLLAVDDVSRVWLLDPETTAIRSLTPNGVTWPRWAPGGAALTVGTDRSVTIIGLDGTAERSFATGWGVGVLSPDEKTVAVSGPNGRVQLVERAGTSLVEVSTPFPTREPLWRPAKERP